MSRKLFAFLLTELKIVRVRCGKCDRVAELTVTQMKDQYGKPDCPFCREQYSFFPDGINPFTQLGQAIEEFQKHGSKVGVEFILEEKC